MSEMSIHILVGETYQMSLWIYLVYIDLELICLNTSHIFSFKMKVFGIYRSA